MLPFSHSISICCVLICKIPISHLPSCLGDRCIPSTFWILLYCLWLGQSADCITVDTGTNIALVSETGMEFAMPNGFTLYPSMITVSSEKQFRALYLWALWIIPFWFSALHCCFAFTLVCRYSLNKDASSNILRFPAPSALGQLLSHLPSLLSLNLQSCSLLDDATLLPLSSSSPYLTSLTLSCCSLVSDPSLLAIASRLSYLQALYRPRLHTGISPYTTVLYKGLAYTQYTHFLWVVPWLCGCVLTQLSG